MGTFRRAFILQPGAGHWDVNSSHDIAVSFVEELLDRRIPPRRCPYETLPVLNKLAPEDGWIGVLEHHREYEEGNDRGFEIIDKAESFPFLGYDGDGENTQWLMSESFASKWLDFELGSGV